MFIVFGVPILQTSHLIYYYTIRGEAIRPIRVVVVDVAASVHVPRVISVATVRAAVSERSRTSLHPIYNMLLNSFLYLFESDSFQLLIPSRTSITLPPQ